MPTFRLFKPSISQINLWLSQERLFQEYQVTVKIARFLWLNRNRMLYLTFHTPHQGKIVFRSLLGANSYLTPMHPLPSAQQCQQYEPGHAAKEGASAVTEIATGIIKNYLKALSFAVLS